MKVVVLGKLETKDRQEGHMTSEELISFRMSDHISGTEGVRDRISTTSYS